VTRLAIAAALAGAAISGLAGCAGPSQAQQATTARAGRAQLSLAADDRMLAVPAGRAILGSTSEERTAASDDYVGTSDPEAAAPRPTFDDEADRHAAMVAAFRIDLMPVTQAQYAEFVVEEHVTAPSVDAAAWRAEGFTEDFAPQVARFTWTAGRPPDRREDHPVVLVSWLEAGRYCAWRGELRGRALRLPTADEFEKAARGDSGLAYPWGNLFEASKLNSAVQKLGDTAPVGSYPAGASPYGALDMAGNVLQWTQTSGATPDDAVVKGSAWDDPGGIGRGASQSQRKKTARQVRVGFRCAGAVSAP
jgi:formylglycine-generating enzyme required for sulfatase activity